MKNVPRRIRLLDQKVFGDPRIPETVTKHPGSKRKRRKRKKRR